MDKFLERYKLPKITSEKTENLNVPISIKEIEFVVKILPTEKTPCPETSTGEYHQTFSEKNTNSAKILP